MAAPKKGKQIKHASVPGVTFVRALDGIAEYRLDANGLQILLLPEPASLVAGVMVTYHVGSRNEAIGYTGATHLLEHLMFKGSEKFNKELQTEAWDLLDNKGALVNASTFTDRTNYYEVVPKKLLPTALSIEADRMRHAYLNEEDRISEMPVVRNEYERHENIPVVALDTQLWALAYQAHPYHHPTIGWKSDIEGVSIDRLKQFYNDFYHPDNATLTVVGGFDEKDVLSRIVNDFGIHPKAPAPLLPLYTEEPKQEGERRGIVKRASTSNVVALAHKIPGATHVDIPPLLLLARILSEGKTSRLFRALIDTSKATEVMSLCQEFRDPSLFVSYIGLTPGQKHEVIERLVKNEYDAIKKSGVTKQELEVAKQSMRSYTAARRDGAYALLSSLNEEIALGDWARFSTLPKVLAAVTSKDIRRVAKTYLVDDQSTIGYFIGTSV